MSELGSFSCLRVCHDTPSHSFLVPVCAPCQTQTLSLCPSNMCAMIACIIYVLCMFLFVKCHVPSFYPSMQVTHLLFSSTILCGNANAVPPFPAPLPLLSLWGYWVQFFFFLCCDIMTHL